jgi:hypothetical protein
LFDWLLFRTLSLYRRAEQKEKGSARLFKLAAKESSRLSAKESVALLKNQPRFRFDAGGVKDS